MKRMQSVQRKEDQSMTIASLIRQIPAPDTLAQQEAEKRWDSLAKLPGSLGALEWAVIRLAGIQHTAHPTLTKKRTLVFCADNGVLEEQVSPSAQSVTAAQAVNFARGGGTINVFSRAAGADVVVIDVGIACPYDEPRVVKRKIRPGTANMTHGPAMTREECERAILCGAQFALDAAADGVRLLILGEMGIGNTTTSSAVSAVLLQRPAEQTVSRGAGSAERMAHKASVIRRAIDGNRPNPKDPIDVLSKVGGLDLAALCGAFLGAAAAGIAAVGDGVSAGAAALCAVRLAPAVQAYLLPSHCSAEPSARMQLDALDLQPLLSAGMCLGEGTGAALAAGLFDRALEAYEQVVGIDEI